MPSTWPLWLRRLIEETTILFAQSYELARQRTLGSHSPCKRLMAERDEAILDAKLCRREIAVFRRSREGFPHHKRSHYAPQDRFEILQIMRLRQWSIRDTAKHFVLHYNTVWSWSRAWRLKENVGLFFSALPWNKLSDGARWAVHELRRLVSEIEFGTRSIAMHLLRSGIQISRSSVQRILREKKPPAPPKPISPAAQEQAIVPHCLLRPRQINMVWHLDMTVLDLLFARFYIAAVLDGFSRKLLALRVYPDAPSTAMILRLLRRTVTDYGIPRFLITDHGCQFRRRFKEAIRSKFSICLVKGRLRSYHTNGKVERFFRTFKWWQRLTLLFPSRRSIQKKLDIYMQYYNMIRPQWNLGKRTPDEVWNGIRIPQPMLLAERNPAKPAINIRRRHYKGDPHLPVVDIWR